MLTPSRFAEQQVAVLERDDVVDDVIDDLGERPKTNNPFDLRRARIPNRALEAEPRPTRVVARS